SRHETKRNSVDWRNSSPDAKLRTRNANVLKNLSSASRKDSSSSTIAMTGPSRTRALLTRCAMRLLSARHPPTACRHQATYTETPQRGRFSGPDMNDFWGRLYPTIAEPALGRADRPSLGELAFGRGRLVPRGEKTSSSATLTNWATESASIFRMSSAR